MSHRLRMMAGGAALVAGALFVLMEIAWTVDTLRSGDAPFSEVAGNPVMMAASVVGLLGAALAIPAVMGIYRQQAETSGTFGLVAAGALGFALVLVAGVQWLMLFVAPWVAEGAPALLDADDPGGTLGVGFMVSFIALSVGSVLFGASTLLAKTYAKWPAVLLIISGITGFLPFQWTFSAAFAGVAMIGYGLQLRHMIAAEQPAPAPSMPAAPAAPAM
jgi:hypothetical protein